MCQWTVEHLFFLFPRQLIYPLTANHKTLSDFFHYWVGGLPFNCRSFRHYQNTLAGNQNSLTDFSESEIAAIESTFQGINKYYKLWKYQKIFFL